MDHTNCLQVDIKTLQYCWKGVSVPKKSMNMCVSDIEESENGVGVGVNATMLLERIGIIRLSESFRFLDVPTLNKCLSVTE
jgi:hypothetical protein